MKGKIISSRDFISVQSIPIALVKGFSKQPVM